MGAFASTTCHMRTNDLVHYREMKATVTAMTSLRARGKSIELGCGLIFEYFNTWTYTPISPLCGK